MKKSIFAAMMLSLMCLAGCGQAVGKEDKVSYKQDIILYSETAKVEGIEIVNDEVLKTLETVPDASVSYVAVDGHGEPMGMGVHFQGYSVGVNAKPSEGYKYVRCESETIEFYEEVYNEYLGYDVPRFLVPESGNHIIYVYYESK